MLNFKIENFVIFFKNKATTMPIRFSEQKIFLLLNNRCIKYNENIFSCRINEIILKKKGLKKIKRRGFFIKFCLLFIVSNNFLFSCDHKEYLKGIFFIKEIS